MSSDYIIVWLLHCTCRIWHDESPGLDVTEFIASNIYGVVTVLKVESVRHQKFEILIVEPPSLEIW